MVSYVVAKHLQLLLLVQWWRSLADLLEEQE